MEHESETRRGWGRGIRIEIDGGSIRVIPDRTVPMESWLWREHDVSAGCRVVHFMLLEGMTYEEIYTEQCI